ncbi:MAG TPA: uracil-DNA glycosylase family protein [Gaiellaceae bacterium]|nr:uracil-DNA glycosylase family protein [Gaiellaceae bacterium]
MTTNARGLSFGPVNVRATNPKASTGKSQPCWNAIATTASTATTPATMRADVSLTGFGNENRPLMTARKSAYRSLASLQRDTASCRACADVGFPLESLPVHAPYAEQRAYMYGQAPGIVEGQERLPWRGRAGQTLRRWLELDEDGFYATFYCASVTRCYPGRAPSGRGDRTPTPREQELCAFWRERELELLRPRLIVTVGGLALRALLGENDLTAAIGERFDLDGVPVIPLPHPSGASSWPNVPANRVRLDRALALVKDELMRV